MHRCDTVASACNGWQTLKMYDGATVAAMAGGGADDRARAALSMTLQRMGRGFEEVDRIMRRAANETGRAAAAARACDQWAVDAGLRVADG